MCVLCSAKYRRENKSSRYGNRYGRWCTRRESCSYSYAKRWEGCPGRSNGRYVNVPISFNWTCSWDVRHHSLCLIKWPCGFGEPWMHTTRAGQFISIYSSKFAHATCWPHSYIFYGSMFFIVVLVMQIIFEVFLRYSMSQIWIERNVKLQLLLNHLCLQLSTEAKSPLQC